MRLDLIFCDMLLIKILIIPPCCKNTFLLLASKRWRRSLKEVLIEIPARPCDHVSALSREVGVTARAPHRIH